MMRDDTSITVGSGNVFADLGLPDADDRLIKARLATVIDDIITRHGFTQADAGQRLGISQPDVSHLLRGRLKGFSLERLLWFVRALGGDIEIKVRQPEDEREGHMRLLVA